MFHTSQTNLIRGLITLIVLLALLAAFWWYKVSQPDLESVRQTLSVLVQIETAFFALTIAGLAFVSTVLANQSRRLDRLRWRWLNILKKTQDGVLEEISEIYKQKFDENKAFPASFKYSKITHLRDAEIITYLPAIVDYTRAMDNNSLMNLDSAARDLDADSMLLFRISSAVLFAEALDGRLRSDPIAELINKLRNIERAENIIMLTNNMYDSRLAAHRGLPIFVFFTLASIVTTLATLSTLSSVTYSKWLYGVNLLPIVVIVLFAGFYISQILRRYF